MWFSFLLLLLNDAMFKEIDFKSQRVYCRGRLYEPSDNESNGAGVVLAHGFVGTMDAGLFPMLKLLPKRVFTHWCLIIAVSA